MFSSKRLRARGNVGAAGRPASLHRSQGGLINI